MEAIVVPTMLFLMIAVIVIGLPLAKAYARRMDRGAQRPQLPSSDLLARLERIEQGIEAMAIEIERISEGQRFTTALLADKRGVLPAGAAPALPHSPARHDTPAAAPATTHVGTSTTPGTSNTGVPNTDAPNTDAPNTGDVNPADGTIILPAARRS